MFNFENIHQSTHFTTKFIFKKPNNKVIMKKRDCCDLCEADYRLFEKIFVKNNYTFVKCQNCGFIFTVEVPSTEDLKEAYSKNYYNGNVYKNYQEKLFEHRSVFISYLSNFQSITGIKAGKILEIGCATGDFLDAASFLGYEAYGIEISEWAASIAKEKGHKVINTDITISYNNKEIPEKFNAIFMWDVFEHLAYPNKVIKNISSLLVEGGVIVINTLNIGSPTVKYFSANWSHFYPPFHLSYFDMKTIKRLLINNNYRIVRLTTTGPLFFDDYINKHDFCSKLFRNKLVYKITKKLKLGYDQLIIAKKI